MPSKTRSLNYMPPKTRSLILIVVPSICWSDLPTGMSPTKVVLYLRIFQMIRAVDHSFCEKKRLNHRIIPGLVLVVAGLPQAEALNQAPASGGGAYFGIQPQPGSKTHTPDL